MTDVDAARLRKVLLNTSVTITIVDAAGHVTMTTGDQKPILGYDPAWWHNRSLADLAHPDDVERGFALLAEAVAAPGEEVSAEVRARHADGHYDWVELTAVSLLDDPDVAGIVITSRNISDRKAVEADLAVARDSAMALAQAKSDYVATVSHEIRSPLHAILGLAELVELRLRSGADDEASEWAEGIRREATRLRRLIDDLLDLARIDAGRVEIAVEPFSLRDVVHEAAQVSRAAADAKGLQLTVHVDPALTDQRLGDVHRLRQVLVNLVTNAVKFTTSGSVDIEVTAAEGGAAPAVGFSVHDTGPGIPDDAMHRLFEPFSQVSTSDSRTGSGLGLAISARLVEALGGRGIDVSTLVGHGSTFSFVLPLPRSDRRPTPESPQGLPDVAPAIETRVLVADDNATNRLLVAAQLAQLGFDATVVGSAAEAIELAADDHFDVVLMDCHMPEVDGLEATRRIRRAERGTGRHIPVLALTAAVLDSNREACARAGMDGFLAKPIDAGELGAEIRRVTRARTRDRGRGADRAATPTARAGSDPRSGGAGVSSVVDRRRLERLVRELGAGPVSDVVATFRSEVPGRLRSLLDANRVGDDEQVRRAAHGLRSPSALLGASALAESMRAIEEAAGPTPSLDATALGALVDETITVLTRTLDDLGATPATEGTR